MEIGFDSNTPIMQGTWYNPRTGDSFTVRDSFFENNEYVVSTTDGRMIPASKMQSYVRASEKDIAAMRTQRNESKQPAHSAKSSIPADILNEISGPANDPLHTPIRQSAKPQASLQTGSEQDIERLAGLNTDEYESKTTTEVMESKPLGNIYDQSTEPRYTENINYEIIQRALGTISVPGFDVKISWKDFPANKISALVDMMGIDEKEIIDYYLRLVNVEEIVDSIKNQLHTFIFERLRPNVPETQSSTKEPEKPAVPVKKEPKEKKEKKEKEKKVKEAKKIIKKK